LNELSVAEASGDEMQLFTLLIFSRSDKVTDVKSIRAADVAAAVKSAEHIMLTSPTAAGYQLWRSGNLVAKTFPVGAA